MSELRWILLGAGLALIAGIYLWGLRTSRRSAAPESGRTIVYDSPPVPEPPAVVRAETRAESRPEPRQEPRTDLRSEPRLEPRIEPRADARLDTRVEPSVRFGDETTDEHAVPSLVEIDEDAPSATQTGGGRREPTLGQRLTAPSTPASAPGGPITAGPRADRTHAEPPSAPLADEDESEDAVAARAQRIIAIRVTAPSPSRFEGSLLHEAVQAEGFQFGRYQIFHRNDPMGRAVISLASLREPGTFDPATMAGAAYAGIAVFSVLPGPLPAQQLFEELLAVGRSLAGRLGGNLQDDRGMPLSVQRIAQLREEMLAFDRERAGRPGR